MSEKRVQEPDSMDRLMELQSRLRELTEAKKAKWRELGTPLPEAGSATPPSSTHEVSGRNGAGEDARGSAGPRTATSPTELAEPSTPAQPSTPAEPSGSVATQTPGAVSAIAAENTAAEKTEAPIADSSHLIDRRFARRRDSAAEWSQALKRTAGEARKLAGAFWRQAVGRARDLTGGLGTPKGKPRPRRGDPVTAEELIDDRSLGARLLGAAVFFVGLVSIGAVALVQLGKLEIPWLEDNALPAATATAGSGIDVSGGAPLPKRPSATTDSGVALQAGGEEESPETGAMDYVAAGSAERSSADLRSESSSADGRLEAAASEALAREVLEFTRLQGELAFLLGEYEIARAAFERGEADCEELNTHYSSVDSAHLLLSRVVARWREVPYRQVKAYEEISGMVDGTLRHFAASGCGLNPSELPGGE